MSPLPIISGSFKRSADIAYKLADVFKTRFYGLDALAEVPQGQFLIVDVDLKDGVNVTTLRDWFRRGPKIHKAIFVTGKESRIETVRAYAIGASEVVHRPIVGKALLAALWGDFRSLTEDQSEFAEEKSAGVVAAHSALQHVFSSACLDGQFDLQTVETASGEVVNQIEGNGLASWIEAVRKHHSQTYQHSLLVTGVAVTFGERLGFSASDRQRLAAAGMLHDIGKARIPVAILEKPGPLDDDERAVIRDHPQFGFDALREVQNLDPVMTDMVVHHHEYLDGSGYPHGLQGREISDLVRIITIADIFGALIERRSYKTPKSGEAAYQILKEIGPKLDNDLVREFGCMAQLTLEPA